MDASTENFYRTVSRDPIPSSGQDLATVCVLCSHNCGMRVDVEENKIIKVRSDESNPISKGYSCNKGYTIGHYVNHAQRLEHPLKRSSDGTFQRISWDQATREIGEKLGGIWRAHGGTSIALIGVGGQGNHMDGHYALPFLIGLGSPWWFNALGQEKTQHPLVDRWMFRAPPNAYLHADIHRSQYVVLLGTNPLLSNRGQNATEYVKALHNDEGRTLVVVDPRKNETAKRADVHVPLRPGSDAYFLLGLAAHIVQNDFEDGEFLKDHVLGVEEIKSVLRKVDVREMARRCEIPWEQIAQVAEGIAKAESACLYMDLGLEQGLFSTLTAYLMRLVLVLTGNIGNRGGATFHGLFSPKAPPIDRKPHRAPVSGIEGIEALVPYGMFSPNLVPEEILSGRSDRIRAVIVEGSNPLRQYADTQRYREAFKALDLLVVIEPAFTEAAQAADYVLPTPVGYEKWETAGFPRGYPEIHTQVRPPVVQGPEEALPEAEIYFRIARAMGLVEKAPGILNRLAKRALSALGAPVYLGALMALAAAKGGGGRKILARSTFWLYQTLGTVLPAPSLAVQWLITQMVALTRRKEIARTYPETASWLNPFAVGHFLYQKILEHPEGVEIGKLDEARNLEDHCTYPDHKIRLTPEPMLGEIQRALAFDLAGDPEFPFILNGGRRTHWNANTIQRNPAWRKGKDPHCALSLSPVDADRLDVRPGDSVRVETRRGSVELPCAIDADVRPGNVSIPNGFGLAYPDPATGELKMTGVCVNELTDAKERDPFTGSPYHKYIRCKVVPVGKRAVVAA